MGWGGAVWSKFFPFRVDIFFRRKGNIFIELPEDVSTHLAMCYVKTCFCGKSRLVCTPAKFQNVFRIIGY